MAELVLAQSKHPGFRLNRELWKHILLIGPLVLYLIVFFVYPLGRVLIQSVFDPEFTNKHYMDMIKNPVYLQVFLNTLEISFVTTLMCIVLGYPVAYYLSGSKSYWATILLVAITLPFWISLLIRTYAWMIILGRYGVVNDFLLSLGWVTEPLRLIHNRIGMYVGMIYVMFPYSILPMLSVMHGIDRGLIRAAGNLGSTPWQAFWHVFIPLSLPGIGAALLLTFIRSMGGFITPSLMGGHRDTMIAMSISYNIENLVNWGFVSALSVLLLMIVIILFFIYNRFLGIDMLWGGKRKFRSRASKDKTTDERMTKPGFISRSWNLLWNREQDSSLDRTIWRFQSWLDKTRTAIYVKSPQFFRKINWNKVALTAVCLVVFVFMILPLFIVVPIAFSNDFYLRFPPQEWGLRLLERYLTSTEWMRSTWNSFKVAIPVMFLATFLGTLASLSLVRGKYRGKQTLYALILSPIIVPFIITSVSMYFLFVKLKLIGTIFGLVLAHTVLAVPFVVIIMTAALKGFDETLEQASMNLGAGKIHTFLFVTFPIIRPGVLTAALFAFITSFDELIVTLFICGVAAQTLPKQMWIGIRDEINPTIAAVAALLVVFSILLMSLGIFLRNRQERLHSRRLEGARVKAPA